MVASKISSSKIGRWRGQVLNFDFKIKEGMIASQIKKTDVAPVVFF